MRDHGGNLDWAIEAFGGRQSDWIDLSTGINPSPYPVPALPARSWGALPTSADILRLAHTAQRAYRSDWPVLPLAGAQAAIQLIPLLAEAGTAHVLSPTYNEHAATLRSSGWIVKEVRDVADLAGAELAVVVNPNNPDGRRLEAHALRAIAPDVGRLVVDESFADVDPPLSVLTTPLMENVLVLRSFGKFFGLAGLRLGFAFGPEPVLKTVREHAGPWPVSGPAIEIGCQALADTTWQTAARTRLAADARRLDALAERAGWSLAGGCDLFRTYATPAAVAARDCLARARIWSRIFPWSPHWLRLGLPAGRRQWARVEQALSGERE